MAQNKKSFVLYTDLIHVVRKLSKEDAGELFLHILEYVNDTQPTTQNILVDLTFETIKQQLKRDLEKWKQRSETNSKNGAMGGRGNKNDKNQTKTPNQTMTIDINGNPKILNPKLFHSMNNLLADTQYIETLCINLHMRDPQLIKHRIETFFVELQNRGSTYKDEQDAKHHFANWLKIELEKETKQKLRNPHLQPTNNTKITQDERF